MGKETSLNNHWVRYPFLRFNQWGSDDNVVKIVPRNLLLPLYSDPSYQTSEPDNNRSPVGPKETMSTQVAIVVNAITSHVHNLSTCEGAQVTNMFQKGLEYVTALFQEY